MEDEVAEDYLGQFKVAEFKNKSLTSVNAESDDEGYFRDLN